MAKSAAKKAGTTKPHKKHITPKPVKAIVAKAVKAITAAKSKKAASKKVVTANKKVVAKKAPVVRAPVVSKDELRTQIEKLQNSIVALRTKNRETTKSLKAAEAKISELEHELSQVNVRHVAEKPVLSQKARMPKVNVAPAAADEPDEVVEAVWPTDESQG